MFDSCFVLSDLGVFCLFLQLVLLVLLVPLVLIVVLVVLVVITSSTSSPRDSFLPKCAPLQSLLHGPCHLEELEANARNGSPSTKD